MRSLDVTCRHCGYHVCKPGCFFDKLQPAPIRCFSVFIGSDERLEEILKILKDGSWR